MTMRSVARIKDGKIIPIKTQAIGINDFEILLKGCEEHQGFEEEMTAEGVYAILKEVEIVEALNGFIDRFEIEITSGDVRNISIEALPLFEVPEGVRFCSLHPAHFLALAKKKGRGPILRALENVERWFSKDDREISVAAAKIICAFGDDRE